MRPRVTLYVSAIFLSSSLLFLVEPMAGKRLLPLLGGSSAVWITCLVFFQTALLLGYLCAHAIATRLSRRAQLRGVWILTGAEPGTGVCHSESPSARLHGAAGLQRAVGFDNADRAAFSCFVGHESAIAVLVRSWAFRACFCRAALPAVCAFQFWIAAGAAGLSSAGGTELQPANADTGMVRGISCVRYDLRRHHRQQKKRCRASGARGTTNVTR